MQTFLPYPSYAQSAAALDDRRLNKQKMEAMQLLIIVVDLNDGFTPDRGRGWANHPATRMWLNYRASLALYGAAMCVEWLARGRRDNVGMLAEFSSWANLDAGSIEAPWWLGNGDFHAAHRSMLLKKDPSFYGGRGWEQTHEDYLWPGAAEGEGFRTIERKNK